MVKEKPEIADESGDKYKYGFVTDIAADTAPKGLNEDIIRLISRKKGEPEWLLERRLKAFDFWQRWPGLLRSTRFLTAFPSLPLTAPNWPKWALFSAQSPKP